jgi:hypothetical protein
MGSQMKEPLYTLRVSVKCLGKEPIEQLEGEPSITVGQLTVTVKARWPFLILLARDFASEAEAEAFLPKIKGGLWSVALDHNIAFIPYFERRSITYSRDPDEAARNLAKSFGQPIKEPLEPVHGLTEEEGYTIFRSGENIRFFKMGNMHGYLSTGWENVSKTLAEGFQKARYDIGRPDTTLATAIDLYLAHFYETSIRARFLTLITCLEVLAPVTARHPTAVRAITDFRNRIEIQLRDSTEAEERDALKALLSEIGRKTETSKTRRVRSLMLAEAPLSQRDREVLAKEVVDAYILRGTVVHSGAIDANRLHEAHEIALRAVKLLLRSRLGLADEPCV